MLVRILSRTFNARIFRSCACPDLPRVLWIVLFCDFIRDIFTIVWVKPIFELTMELLMIHNEMNILIIHILYLIDGIFYIIGGWLADSYFGKYNVFVTSLFTTALLVNALLFLSTFHNLFTYEQQRSIFIVVIHLYSLSTFGRSCKTPLCSEQYFLPEEELNIRQYYIIIFWLKSFAYIIGYILVPTLVKTINGPVCFENFKCIPIPYIILLIVDILYTIIICLCRKLFSQRAIQFGILEHNLAILVRGFRKRLSSSKTHVRRRRIVDYASDLYDRQSIKNMERVTDILPIFFIFSIYALLNTQLHSSWIIQCTYLKSENYFTYLTPRQILVIKNFFYLILIPIVYKLIPEWLSKFDTYLKWIGLGFFLTCCSSIFTTLLQQHLENGRSPLPHDYGQLRIFNAHSAQIAINSSWTGNEIINPLALKVFLNIEIKGNKTTKAIISTNQSTWITEFEGIQHESVSYVIRSNSLERITGTDPIKHFTYTYPRVFFICGGFECPKQIIKIRYAPYRWEQKKFAPDKNGRTLFTLYFPGSYQIYIDSSKPLEARFLRGGVYAIMIVNNGMISKRIIVYEIMTHNKINIYWIIPQFFLSALGDVFLWIPMKMFVYVQSPANFRATMNGLFLFGQCLGLCFTPSALYPMNNYFGYMVIFTITMFLVFISYLCLSERYTSKLPSDN